MKSFIPILFILLNVQCSHSKNQGFVNPTSPENGVVVVEQPERQEKFRFAIISDMNGSYGSKNYGSDVIAAVDYLLKPETKINFVLSTGDMVAGQKSNLDYAGMWESFHAKVTRPILSKKLPLFPSPGNHDAFISRKIERQHYENSWNDEKPLADAQTFEFVKGVKQNFPFQYAFKKGSALFISLDNTAVQNWSESTLNWMEEIFKQESQVKLKFVYGHVPLLPFAFKKESEYVARGSVGFLNKVEELFEKYKVDVFFSGHSHVYYPGRRGLHTEYISVPLLGSGTRYLISQSNAQERSRRGLLIIEYDSEGNWSVEHRQADSFEIIDDNQFAPAIQMPKTNTSLCSKCSQFPESHFLDKNKRIIYRRRDL